jgi:hypothetical protein
MAVRLWLLLLLMPTLLHPQPFLLQPRFLTPPLFPLLRPLRCPNRSLPCTHLR